MHTGTLTPCYTTSESFRGRDRPLAQGPLFSVQESGDNPKVARWRTRPSEYTFEVQHIAGIDRDNPVANALSRLHPVQVSAISPVNLLQVVGASKRVHVRCSRLSGRPVWMAPWSRPFTDWQSVRAGRRSGHVQESASRRDVGADVPNRGAQAAEELDAGAGEGGDL